MTEECRECESAIIECMDEEGTIYQCPRCGDKTNQWGKKFKIKVNKKGTVTIKTKIVYIEDETI